MNTFHMNWWKEQEEEREKQHLNQAVERLNREFSRIIETLSVKLDKTKYRGKESEFNRHLVSCSIWSIGYLNNLHNPRVIALQAEWLYYLFQEEAGTGKIQGEDRLKKEIHALIRRLHHVDARSYQILHQNSPDIHSMF